ncbi:MAG: hypothetical protein ABSC76_01395 [Terracidiphilus sp.]|jgi:hypothetical protein
MNEPLRPSSLGEILDRTAHLYRSRFLVFLGISAIPTGVVLAMACVFFLIEEWIRTGAAAKDVQALAFVFLGGLAILALPVLLAVTALAAAAISHGVSVVHLGGATTIRDAYKSAWRLGWRYNWLYLMQALFIWVAPIVAWIVLLLIFGAIAALSHKAGMGNLANGAFVGLTSILSFAAFVGYGIWMLLRLSLAFPACVVEQMKAWAAVKRSFALSQGTKGRIFLLFLLVAALGWLLSMAVTLPLTILLYLIPGMNNPQHEHGAGVAVLLILYAAAFAAQSLLKPVYSIALMLFYYDQRIRLEGFDIEWMMQQAGMVPEPQIPTVQAPLPVPEVELEPAPWLPVIPRNAQSNEPEAPALQPGENE